jgi:hypothetical protein
MSFYLGPRPVGTTRRTTRFLLLQCLAVFPAVLPGRLARPSCPANLPGRLARPSCPAVMPSRLARPSCPAVLPGRLARPSGPGARPSCPARPARPLSRGLRSVGPVRRAGRFCSGLRGRSRTYYPILRLADHALFKMVRYVLLRPLRSEQNWPARRTGPTDRNPL